MPPLLLLSLLSRSRPQHRKCREKYGSLWEDYCRAVKFRMLPFIY